MMIRFIFVEIPPTGNSAKEPYIIKRFSGGWKMRASKPCQVVKKLVKRSFFQRKIIDPIVKLLRQGISPEKIALGMAVGVVIGIFPVIGSTTLLCTIAALLLRLNLPAIQLVNYLVYPLQIALLIPFFQFGAWLFGVDPLPLSAAQLMSMFKTDLWDTIRQLWDTTLRAIAAWSLICLPTVAGLYYLLKPLLKKIKSRKANLPSG
jgi:uncharacterized protein (DUF2062 family)